MTFLLPILAPSLYAPRVIPGVSKIASISSNVFPEVFGLSVSGFPIERPDLSTYLWEEEINHGNKERINDGENNVRLVSDIGDCCWSDLYNLRVVRYYDILNWDRVTHHEVEDPIACRSCCRTARPNTKSRNLSWVD